MTRSRCLLKGLPVLLLFAPVPSQVPSGAEDRAHEARRVLASSAARCLHVFVDGFVRGKYQPKDPVFLVKFSSVDYLRLAVDERVIRVKRKRETTHFSMLQRIVAVAEKFPSRETADAMLALAASGYSRDLYSPNTLMVRDLGLFALTRSDDATIWNHVMEVATGAVALGPVGEAAALVVDGVEVVPEQEIAETARVMRRVAAVRVLGMRAEPVFKVAIEKCLSDTDPRVRLAAAEAFGQMRDLKFLYTLTRKIESESHPLVVMALLAAVERTLAKYKDKVPIGRGMNIARSLVGLLGRKGWRNDMTIVGLIRKYPVKMAVPALIHLMRGAQAELDPILKVVNKDASPILADEVFQTLRMVTGAVLPPDPNQWQEFWEREKDRLQLVAPYRRRRAGRGGTRGSFFGIPVVGREVVFVIDTSGSMKEPIRSNTVVSRPKVSPVTPRKGKGRSKKGRKKPRRPAPRGYVSRLDAAKTQTLNAVQGIPNSTKFHLVTFSSGVRVWNQEPVRAGPSAFRTMTETLGRVASSGGTNVYAALIHVLGAAQMRYGQQIKSGVEEVFLLSDGLPSTGAVSDPDEILRVVSEINRYRKIRIHTVFTGTGKGADFMQRLAAQNHGVFVRR